MNDSVGEFLPAAEDFLDQPRESVNTLLAAHLTLIGERLKDISRNIEAVRRPYVILGLLFLDRGCFR